MSVAWSTAVGFTNSIIARTTHKTVKVERGIRDQLYDDNVKKD